MLTTAMADKKLIIADGHHRYETALNYSEGSTQPAPARRSRSTAPTILPQPAYPEAAVMMTFVNMDSDGLVILPTHRVVHSLAGFDASEVFGEADEFFTMDHVAGRRCLDLIETLKAQQGTAFIAVMRGGTSCCGEAGHDCRCAGRMCPNGSGSST